MGRTRRLRAIYGLFLVSGAAGLIYEVVWARLLKEVFGVTAYAVATVLAAYLGGLALGAWLLGSRVDRQTHPLRFYGFLELGIAATAFLGALLLRFLEPLHDAAAIRLSPGSPMLLLIRVLLASLVVLPPTFLMGGTLPAVTRAVRSWRECRSARGRGPVGSGDAGAGSDLDSTADPDCGQLHTRFCDHARGFPRRDRARERDHATRDRSHQGATPRLWLGAGRHRGVDTRDHPTHERAGDPDATMDVRFGGALGRAQPRPIRDCISHHAGPHDPDRHGLSARGQLARARCPLGGWRPRRALRGAHTRQHRGGDTGGFRAAPACGHATRHRADEHRFGFGGGMGFLSVAREAACRVAHGARARRRAALGGPARLLASEAVRQHRRGSGRSRPLLRGGPGLHREGDPARRRRAPVGHAGGRRAHRAEQRGNRQ